jgi:hydrogenase nickel incorporation protein HypA/HybF
MHELSIADAIVTIAARHAAGRRVTSVHVRIGRLRQVVPAALTFAFELVACGTSVEGAVLELEEIAVAGRCRSCGAAATLDGLPLRCPACEGLDVELTAGEELLVEEIEVRDEVLTTTGRSRP